MKFINTGIISIIMFEFNRLIKNKNDIYKKINDLSFFDTILLNVFKFLDARIVIVKLDFNAGSSKQGKARRA